MQPPLPNPTQSQLRLSGEVLGAVASGAPVVALESTVLAHGLPWPQNLELGTEVEAMLRAEGVVPATIAVIEGVPTVGLSPSELRKVAEGVGVAKLSSRELPLAIARRLTGATTVAATAVLAQRAGISVFATGGIGGVHRGSPPDVSADLLELQRTAIVVVCAGAKAVLDLVATREMLETLGVLVLGWETDSLPGFYYRETGLSVDARVDGADELASVWREHRRLGAPGAILVCAPIPPNAEVPFAKVRDAIESALGAADSVGIRGKEVTPFLLRELTAATGGATLTANLALLKNNVRIAASLAQAITR